MYLIMVFRGIWGQSKSCRNIYFVIYGIIWDKVSRWIKEFQRIVAPVLWSTQA